MKKLLFILLISCLLFPAGAQAQKLMQFETRDNPVTLERPVQAWNNFTVVGRKSFLVGKENGVSEIWVVPFKLLHDLDIKVRINQQPFELSLASLARHIWVRPEATTIRFAHSAFMIDATYFAPIESGGIVIVLSIDTSEPLNLIVQFQTDLQPMWPAGLGGQYSYWDSGEKAFVITESRRRFAGMIGSPFGMEGTSTPAHALPNAPIQFRIPVAPGSEGSSIVPIVAAASNKSQQDADSIYKSLLENVAGLYEETYEHFDSVRRNGMSLRLPDDRLSLAIEWAKISLDKGLIDNPDLGRGLVAGFGPSGKSARPGFAWYFGGDAYVNGFAINDYGGAGTMRQALKFLIKYQRDDGKMSHEISQSAGMIPWFEDYPYPYYHADTTPYFLIAMEDYYRHTGDSGFVRQNWPAIQKAYQYCLNSDSNGDGLMDNLKAGLAAVETGKLRSGQTEVDIYLASIWTRALQGMSELSAVVDSAKMKTRTRDSFLRAKTTLNERFWQDDLKMLSFALLTNGRIDEVTPWQAVPLCFDLIRAESAEQMMAKIASEDMETGWGIRSLSRSSEKYEYWSYNNGGVWPFMTLYAIWGGFRAHFSGFAQKQWEAIARLTFTQQLGTISELFSGDRFDDIEAAVPHQLFSTSPVVIGLTRGILGYEPDVPNGAINLSPHWPRYWQEGEVLNLPFGSQKLSISHRHDNNTIEMVIKYTDDRPIIVRMSYALADGEKINRVSINGSSSEFKTEKNSRDRHILVDFSIRNNETVIQMDGEFEISQRSATKTKIPGSKN